MTTETITFDLNNKGNSFKPLNATNGGPWHKRFVAAMPHSNFEAYRAARIPFARNHDSGGYAVYGGPYSHDLSKIFRNFDADETDPASYDFGNTDEDIFVALEAGTETFFRLGESAESSVTPHGAIPPKDFQKWARIAEHIIRHLNEGWANGHTLGIRYWEIWNEPDLRWQQLDSGFWHGTPESFFDFYETVAKHLKSSFPNLKIGGPAIAHDLEWAERFLSEMSRRQVPIDFFSWHIYATAPESVTQRAARIRELLTKYGYGRAESICNEWNYVHDWGAGFPRVIEIIHSIKGASFTMSVISEADRTESIDMLMYYTTHPSAFNGAFDFYSCRAIKGYYPLFFYGKFYDMKYSVRPKELPPHLYTICGVDADGRILCTVTYYDDDDTAPDKHVKLDFGRTARFSVSLLDEEHNGEEVGTVDAPEFLIKNHSILVLREI